MRLYLADYVSLAAQWLGEDLIDRKTADALNRYSSRLPAIFTEACVEFDLRLPNGGWDFSVGVPGDSTTREVLRRSVEHVQPAALQRAVRRWVAPRSKRLRVDSDLFLEFDLRHDSAPCTAPRTIFALASADQLSALTTNSQTGTIRRLLALMPDGAYLRHAYFDPLRRRVDRIVPYMLAQDCARYLANAGWRESAESVADLTRAMPADATVGIHLNLGSGEDLVGIETLTQQLESGSTEQLYQYLEDLALCNAPSRKLLNGWHDTANENGATFTRQTIVKTVFSKGGAVEAKGYLGFMVSLPGFVG